MDALRLHRLPAGRWCLDGHRGAGSRLGAAAGSGGSSLLPGQTALRGARLRPAPRRIRSGHRGALGRSFALAGVPGDSLHLLRRRLRRLDGGRAVAAAAAAGSNLRDVDRIAQGDGRSGRGAHRPRPRRRRSRRRRAGHQVLQVQQEQGASTAREYGRGPQCLRGGARPVVPRAQGAELVGVHRGQTACLCDRPAHLLTDHPRCWTPSPLAAVPAPVARRQTLLCLHHPARLVSQRGRRAGAPTAAVHLFGPHPTGGHLLVSLGDPRADVPGRATPGAGSRGAVMSALAPTLQAWFTDRLAGQRHASPNTIAAYRDTWRLLLAFVQSQTATQPCRLDIADLNADVIGDFLNHLERKETRHLDQDEVDALIAAPDPGTWTGRRDHVLLDVAVQTGLRVSELTSLRVDDVEVGTGAHVRCRGKGRKERCTPLAKETVALLRPWMKERRGSLDDPLFPTRRGTPLTRSAVGCLVAKHAATAARHCPSLLAKHPTPHTLRHSCAMSLLRSGCDTSVIALWLGHENVATTARIYLHGDLATKERALERTRPLHVKPGRYRPADPLLAFLTGLCRRIMRSSKGQPRPCTTCRAPPRS